MHSPASSLLCLGIQITAPFSSSFHRIPQLSLWSSFSISTNSGFGWAMASRTSMAYYRDGNFMTPSSSYAKRLTEWSGSPLRGILLSSDSAPRLAQEWKALRRRSGPHPSSKRTLGIRPAQRDFSTSAAACRLICIRIRRAFLTSLPRISGSLTM